MVPSPQGRCEFVTDEGDEGLLSTKIWGELGRGTWRQFHMFTLLYYFALLSSVKKYSLILVPKGQRKCAQYGEKIKH